MKIPLLLLTVVAGVAAHAQSSDAGRQFHGGPGHSGSYESTPPQLIGLQWRYATGGDVISSPAVADGRAFFGSGDAYLYSVDLGTGTLRWRDSLGAAVNGSPAVHDGRVFVTTLAGDLYAVDARTGARRWRFAAGRALPMPWGHETGAYYASSPAVANGQVVVGARDGRVYALDEVRGTLRWKAETSGQIWASPAIAGERVVVGSADGYVYCLRATDGRRLWRFATDGAALRSEQFGFDRRTVESSAAIVNGVVYVGARDGFLYAIDLATGAERWRFDHKTSWVVTSPAVQDDVVVAGSSDSRFVQGLDARTGQELWRTRTAGIVWSSPAIAGSMVYIGDGVGMLHAFDLHSGAERWSFRTGESVFSSPVVADGLVLFGSADRGLYALRTASEPALARAVLFDSTLVHQSSTDNPAQLARYFRNRGYATLDRAGALAFLREHDASGRPATLVVATDAMVDSAALRGFLAAGNTVVWPGLPPNIWPRDSAGRRGSYATIQWSAPAASIGVDYGDASFDEHAARSTEIGRSFGLEDYRAGWSVRTDQVSTVLARDDLGRAAAWIKEYGARHGRFIHVPESAPFAMFLLAEGRPRGSR